MTNEIKNSYKPRINQAAIINSVYGGNLPKIKLAYGGNLPKIKPAYGGNLPKINPAYRGNLPEIKLAYGGKLPEINPAASSNKPRINKFEDIKAIYSPKSTRKELKSIPELPCSSWSSSGAFSRAGTPVNLSIISGDLKKSYSQSRVSLYGNSISDTFCHESSL